MVKSLIPTAIDGPHSVEGVCQQRREFSALDAAGAAMRIRLSSTVIHVQHDGEPSKASSLTIVYSRKGKLYRVKAAQL